tara:strand:+ start:75 stop:635 length:561 start_codon:yes stop_codon:yes gene_type:complete
MQQNQNNNSQGNAVFGGPYKLYKKAKSGSRYESVVSMCIMTDNRIQARTYTNGNLHGTTFSQNKDLNSALKSAISKLESLMQNEYYPVERIDLVALRDMVAMTEGVVVAQPPKAAPKQKSSPVNSAAPFLNGSASTSVSAISIKKKSKKVNKIKMPNAVNMAPRQRILAPNFYDLIDMAKFGSESK